MMHTVQPATYPVMEHFYTLQGEGAYAGQSAYFIRLGGCDVGCVWCDVKESWDASAHPHMSVTDIVAAALAHPGRIAVVTGGEPSMYELTPLTDALHAAGFRTHIETSASSPLTGDWDWVTLSPKKFKAPLQENLHLANELKIIIFNKSDFQWAESYAAQMPQQCKLYLQTEWDKRDQMTPAIIAYIQEHPGWQLSLQTHKYLNIP
ncbi:7-carboxy-7-deazaguanine synthase QueE [Rurimicrobium arvi]|uniref:7-carboxy-7-deazaguanine synthase n=1 Tax=Rurimicrobium arvi TaxID=2049916 RepID=A0ABP8MM87_9BACT